MFDSNNNNYYTDPKWFESSTNTSPHNQHRQYFSENFNISISRIQIPTLPSSPHIHPPCPISKLPIDIILYIASLRFLSINDIVQWRSTSSLFYNSISLPHATMILQAAYLFQVRPRCGLFKTEQSIARPTSQFCDTYSETSKLKSPPKDIHSLYKHRQLKDNLTRLTKLLTHPEFQPRLMRSSYSFRGEVSTPFGNNNAQQMQDTSGREYSRKKTRKTRRTRRDLQNYPIFITGNPPDLVRLAIEFGHIPFVDHLLHRGFRPLDLPEYFELIPVLSTESDSEYTDNLDEMHNSMDPQAILRQRARTSRQIIKGRASELNSIWEQMRSANQELIDACSDADIDRVLSVLDATLIHPRPALDHPSHQQTEPRSIFRSEGELSSSLKNKGKQRHLGNSESHVQHDSTSSGTVAYGLESDALFASEGAGVSSSHRGSTAHSRNRTVTTGDDYIFEEVATKELDPAIAYRTMFQPRQRVDSNNSQVHYRSLSQFSNYAIGLESVESQSHMPWVDGRALTSALLAVCLRRNGYESEEAETLEESKTVPIVNEILKYDCMLTAQSLGQAVLSVAYSRRPNSIKRAYEKRMKTMGKSLDRGRNSIHYYNQINQNSTTFSDGNDGIGIMDLLMERIGPREWLKLIKSYIQRREFEDLAVILEICPFKGQQLEARDKTLESEYRPYSRIAPNDEMNRRRQQARELICHEAGICGVGTRMGQFSGRGPGQSSYNVSSTLHESSRVVFTGSGTRFSNTYMLPRGGFRGIGGNTSSHSSSVGHSTHSTDSDESFQEMEEEGQQSMSEEANQQFARLQDQQHYIAENGSRGCRNTDRDGNIDTNDYRNDLDDNEDDDFNDDHLDAHDSSLAFGGVGSSTTSSSRPGPGIVGIAIQVQAPGYILSSLLKMGFRFFSICDLSVSDTHPLALQFRQQEKMNKLFIEFCMAPNLDDMPINKENSMSNKKAKYGQTNRRKRDHCIYDETDKEYYTRATESFLYPAANYPPRGATSIPAFPTHHPRSTTNGSDITNKQRLSQHSLTNLNTEFNILPSTLTSEINPPQTQVSVLSPSNRLQFVLPVMQLGESFESLATAAAATTSSNALELQSPPQLASGVLPVLPSEAFGHTRYRRSGLAKSMPLPIRASMIEARRLSGLSMSTYLNSEMDSEVPTYHSMLVETTKRRVREHLGSEYIDLMTVGICLHQICFHQKETLLNIVLEHRLIIAQDALSGAVQVAASVGWKRGLEILLMEHGDMEAEIDPVVTTKSDHVHNSASVKWDHATSERLSFVKPRANRDNIVTENINAPRRPRSIAAGGRETLAGRGLRRHRSDGGRMDRPVSTGHSPAWDNGISRNLEGTSSHSFDDSIRPSFDFANMGVHEHNLRSPTLVPQILGSIVPTTRSSSLRVKLTSLLSTGGSITNLNLRKKQKQSLMGLPEENLDLFPANLARPESEARRAQPSVIFLSTAELHTTPSVMLQRKNRNAVVALMAATVRNDPALVHWLIESFADIKIAHIMQALMIACDRGYVRVVQTLVGGGTNLETSEPTENLRNLFRQWLKSQFQDIIRMTLLGPNSEGVGSKGKSTEEIDPTRKRFDSFPFIFLMEASPIFRHYYQILNTLSSSQFMIKERNGSKSRSRSRSRNRASPSTPGYSENVDTFFNVNSTSPLTFSDGTSPLRLHRRQQQDQQSSLGHTSKSLQNQRTRNKPAQEIKQEIIRIMLDPLLEVFGTISFRKALDKMPKDCWWPLDHDVRLIVDQEARKVMVEIITAMKRQQKYLRRQQNRRDQEQHRDGQQSQLSQKHGHASKTENENVKEAKDDHQRWSTRWNKLRRWATLKKKPKINTSTLDNSQEKHDDIEKKKPKSFFGSLRR